MKALLRKVFTVCITIPVCVFAAVLLALASACIYVSDGRRGDAADFLRGLDS